jgi:hypothetical protein
MPCCATTERATARKSRKRSTHKSTTALDDDPLEYELDDESTGELLQDDAAADSGANNFAAAVVATPRNNKNSNSNNTNKNTIDADDDGDDDTTGIGTGGAAAVALIASTTKGRPCYGNEVVGKRCSIKFPVGDKLVAYPGTVKEYTDDGKHRILLDDGDDLRFNLNLLESHDLFSWHALIWIRRATHLARRLQLVSSRTIVPPPPSAPAASTTQDDDDHFNNKKKKAT